MPPVNSFTSAIHLAASSRAFPLAGSSPGACSTSAISSAHCRLACSCSSGDHIGLRASTFARPASLNYVSIHSVCFAISIASTMVFSRAAGSLGGRFPAAAFVLRARGAGLAALPGIAHWSGLIPTIGLFSGTPPVRQSRICLSGAPRNFSATICSGRRTPRLQNTRRS
jgi:hypothetical protein